MKNAARFIYRVGILGILIFSSVGCGLGLMVSPMESAMISDSVSLENPKPNILDIVADVGKSLGYDVTMRMNAPFPMIGLGTNSSPLAGAIIGKATDIGIQVTVQNSGKTLNIVTTATGNLGTGGEEVATKVTSEFKEKLLEKLK